MWGSFSEELRGKPEVHLITNGDVPAELRRGPKTAVMPRQSVNLKFKKAVMRAINKTLGGREEFFGAATA